MIATNIPLFQGINQLPIILDPIILDEGGGICQAEIMILCNHITSIKYSHNISIINFRAHSINHLSSCFVMVCRNSDVESSFSHKTGQKQVVIILLYSSW
jgi:hypothetical protein